MRTKLAPLAALTGLLSLAACSWSWLYHYDVTIADDVELPNDARVVMIGGGDDGPRGMVDVVEEVQAGERSYEGEASTCCSPESVISFYAFVDLNANDEWDEGEPWGEDPNNPVEIGDDGYTAEILIEND